MDTQNPYAAPRSSAAKVVELPPGEAAWRKGKVLVVDHETELPPLCVKCGIETDDRPRKLKLVWYPSWTFIGLFLGFLPFIVLAIIMQKRATVYAHICDRHRARRRRVILLAWLTVFASIVLCIVAGGLDNHLTVPLALLGFIMIFASIIAGIILSRTFSPQQIVKGRVWLKGACPEFLATLPDYPL